MPLGTNDDLLRYVEDTFGVRIPRTRCCAAHRTPAEAFCDSYFARAPVTVWNASRAFGGKTFLLSLLALTEALTLEVSVTVLGGSGQQSARVLDAMGAHWRAPAAPVHLLDGPPGLYTTRLLWGNTITALTASQPSVRGAHPARLRLDEADEMRLPILEAAQGQPMDQGAVRAQTVIASTHQHPDGTMTAVLRRAAEQGWPVYEWCYRETLEPHGWLTEDQVTRKRTEITAQMWRTEFDLQEPSAEGRAIDPEAVEWAFDAALGEAGAAVLDHGWEATPTTAAAAAAGWYAHGADWAQAVDFTVVVTLRCDVQPLQLVAATRTHRRPWPVMIGILNAIATRYPGPVAHDATGGGTVVAEYVTLHDVIDFQMTGRQRRDLFISYIAALERHELKLPRLEPFYREHKYCRVDDVFGERPSARYGRRHGLGLSRVSHRPPTRRLRRHHLTEGGPEADIGSPFPGLVRSRDTPPVPPHRSRGTTHTVRGRRHRHRHDARDGRGGDRGRGGSRAPAASRPSHERPGGRVPRPCRLSPPGRKAGWRASSMTRA